MIPTNHLRRRRARAGVTALALSGLLALTACGSDEESSDETTAATVSEETTAAEDSASGDTATMDTSTADTSTADTLTADTSTADTSSDDTVSISLPIPDFDASGLSDQQTEIMEMVLQSASAAGIEVDADCLVEAVGQLSEEDAQKIVEAGADGSPELSEAGEAIGDQAGECIVMPEISIPDISIPDLSIPEITAP